MTCCPDLLRGAAVVISCLAGSPALSADDEVRVDIVGKASKQPVKAINYADLFPVLQTFDRLRSLYPESTLTFHFKPTNASAPRVQIYYAIGDEIRTVPTDAEGAFDLPIDPDLARAHAIVYTTLPADHQADYEFGWNITRPSSTADATMGYYRLLCAVSESYVSNFAGFAARALVSLQGGLCSPFKLKAGPHVAGATLSWEGTSRFIAVEPSGTLSLPIQDTGIPDSATVHRVPK